MKTFFHRSKALEKPKRDLWDRITEHMKFLLEKKVMTLKKLVSTFLLILLHPQSEKAVKVGVLLLVLGSLLTRIYNKRKNFISFW